MDLAAVGTDVERVIVTEVQLREKVAELAARVDTDYKDRDLLLVGVLKGAIMAMADLTRAMQRHIEMDGGFFLRLWHKIKWRGSYLERSRSRYHWAQYLDR